jgi:5-methylcytosine-specific restriction endonuclease McrBC regulatory subunit McrC
MRRGIVLDYVDRTDELEFVRGRINVQRTALSYYQGHLDLECEYEDFGQDTPLNRILRAAGERIVASASLPTKTRRRMRAILTRFDEVGTLRHGDRRVSLDLRTRHYGDALSLAGHIIDGVHRVLGHGDQLAWTFLIPTPLLVEAGVRRELARHLAPHVAVEKRSLPLQGTAMRMNPDLTFDDIAAVGDVKYKLMSADWSRSDLNQIVAFAAAARTRIGIVVGFHPSDAATLPVVGVGDFNIVGINWRADEDLTPEAASEELALGVRGVLPVEHAVAAA